MAVSHTDQIDLIRDPSLRDKVLAGMFGAGAAIQSEQSPPANHTARVAWAIRVLSAPKTELDKMMPLIVAANAGAASKAAVLGASDAAIASNVDDLVDFFADNDASGG